MTITIDDLLKALQNPDTPSSLENSRETWRRIGQADTFSELGLDSGELDSFLKEWIADNPYNAI